MDHVLNLNTVKRPTLNLTLMDEAQTTLHVKMPTLGMYKEMESISDEMGKAANGDRDSITELYAFVARLVSCNRDMITVTADELRGKYNVDFESLILIYQAYLNFLTKFASEKN